MPRVLVVRHPFNYRAVGGSKTLQPGEYRIPQDVPVDVSDNATLMGYAIIEIRAQNQTNN